MIFDHIRKRISYYKESKTVELTEEDLECEVTDEIERALWELKEDLDLPTEEIVKAVDSRKQSIDYKAEEP